MSGGQCIDLHTHTTCSDGTLTPGQLVLRAADAGLEVLAITDHDTTAGFEQAEGCAAACGIALVPGVEISAAWRAQAIHVLGLWIDPATPALRRALALQAEHRCRRMVRICARLTALGLPGARLLQTVESQPGLPTRAHLARALTEAGIVKRSDDAFRKYLGRGTAAHVAADWPALDVVVGWIVAAGGIASLAHPARYRLSGGARRALLADFKAAGGGAIEVITGANAAHQIEACAAWAQRFELEASIGSDFHGPQQVWNPLGRLAKLPDRVTPVWRRLGKPATKQQPLQ
jgi:predicted metal-dependent phosphoesterase TrpH